MHTFGEEVPA